MSKRRVVKRREQLQATTSQDKKKTKSKPRFGIRKFIKPLLYCIVLIAILYAVLASNLLKINKIEINGNQTIKSEEITSQVRAIITGSSMNQNILFVPVSEIEKQLKKDNYQVAKVEVSKVAFNTLKITITEQKPSLLWKSGNSLSIITENGRGFIGEPNEQLKENLPIVEDLSNLPVKEGDKVVSQEFVTFVNELYSVLPQKGVAISIVQVEESTTEVTVTTKEGYKIRFDTTRPFNEQLTDLLAVLDSLKKQGKKLNQYIDLRINGKVFYK